MVFIPLATNLVLSVSLFTLLKLLIALEKVPTLLSKDGALHPEVANVNSISGATAQTHSGIYSQNCRAYFLIVLLLGLSSVSINLPTLKSASQYAEAGLFHHHLHSKVDETVFVNFAPNLQTDCQASARCSHIGSCQCSKSFQADFIQEFSWSNLPCL